MKYAYFPGCSLKCTGRAYEESLLAVFRTLEIGLEEVEDWNCCGATSYMSVDESASYALAARDLALAEQTGHDLVAPCAACYLVLNKAQHYIRDYPQIRKVVTQGLAAAGLEYQDTVRVRHPLDILYHDVGPAAIAARVKRKLTGLKVAPYYGCQIVRPYATFDDQHEPVAMDKLLEACGATLVPYSCKTRCCGGSQMGTMPETGLHLIGRLVDEAQQRGAQVIATVCPLCQFNLDAFQRRAMHDGGAEIPILYFTQLMAIAFGLGRRDTALHRGLVAITPAVKELAYA